MNNQTIKDFWEQNPCGEHLILDQKGKIDNYKQFFLNYDQFRYTTEDHIIPNLDKINFAQKKVLEVGIGQASDSQQIIDRGAQYHGLDITEEACRRARLRFDIFKKRYETVAHTSALNIPFDDNYFDIVYSHGVLHHIPDIESVSEEIHRVLKPGGQIIIMLYARKSLNYYVSILMIRRFLFLGLWFIDKISVKKLIKKPLFRKHLDNAQREGLLRYLAKDTFLSRNTDGPDNPYSRVYSKKEVEQVFSQFRFERYEQHFLNERHFPLLKILPKKARDYLSQRFGWHLWCYGYKKEV